MQKMRENGTKLCGLRILAHAAGVDVEGQSIITTSRPRAVIVVSAFACVIGASVSTCISSALSGPMRYTGQKVEAVTAGLPIKSKGLKLTGSSGRLLFTTTRSSL